MTTKFSYENDNSTEQTSYTLVLFVINTILVEVYTKVQKLYEINE